MTKNTPQGALNISEALGLAAQKMRINGRERLLAALPQSASHSHLNTRRTFQPIRRHSYLKGRESTFWRGISRRDARQIVLAARRYDLETRSKGKRNGALGNVAIEILDYFANLIDYRTGRLEPSLQTLMTNLRRSKDAIVRALSALRTHGFLDWIRRYVPADDETGRIQVQQTSNAYRLSMPQRALKLLGRYAKTAPVPDDASHKAEELEKEFQAYRGQLSNADLPLFDMGSDDPLAQSLSKLGALFDEKKRESVKRPESLSKDSLLMKIPSGSG